MKEDANTLPLPFEPSAVPLWIDAATFAELAGVEERKARAALSRCANGGTWRKYALKVRTRDGGPASAHNPYLVHVDSLPPALSIAHHERYAKALPEVEVKTGPTMPMPDKVDPNFAKKHAEVEWKMKILAPALEFPKGSKPRAQLLRMIAKRTHTGLDGKPKKFSHRTLSEWVRNGEKAGSPYGLMRKTRDDAPNRCIISRTWDKACPLPLETKAAIAAEIRTYVLSLWKELPGWRTIEQLASSKLEEASRAAGWSAAAYELCRVGRHFVDKNSQTKICNIKTKDAKRWHDEMTPRIRRTRKDYRPGDVVVGDVHPVDIIVTRDDGSEATFRLIAWLDIATDDLFCSLVLLDKGKGVTQAHVMASFAAMVEAWGLPRLLMLDNGSEYSWKELEEGFRALVGLARTFDSQFRCYTWDPCFGPPRFFDEEEAEAVAARESPILRSLPDRPSSKNIEGTFSILEQLLFRAFPGWIGGDRMNKRTHQMGKAPRPFPGTAAQFETTFYEALRFWRVRERPSFQGRSINDVRKAFQKDGGRLPPKVPREALVFALSERVTRKVRPWGAEIGGTWYRSPSLLKHTGETLEFRYAKWAPDYVFYIGPQGEPVQVMQDPDFNYTDGEGARYQQQLNSILNQHVRDLNKLTRKVDVLAEMSRHADARGGDVPVLTGPEIALSPELEAAVEAGKLPAPENEPVQLGYGETLDRKTGEIVRLIPDHYTANHPPLEDDEPDWDAITARIKESGLTGEAAPVSPDAAKRSSGDK